MLLSNFKHLSRFLPRINSFILASCSALVLKWNSYMIKSSRIMFSNPQTWLRLNWYRVSVSNISNLLSLSSISNFVPSLLLFIHQRRYRSRRLNFSNSSCVKCRGIVLSLLIQNVMDKIVGQCWEGCPSMCSINNFPKVAEPVFAGQEWFVKCWTFLFEI